MARNRPRGERFTEPAARAVWAAICALDEGSLTPADGLVPFRAMITELGAEALGELESALAAHLQPPPSPVERRHQELGTLARILQAAGYTDPYPNWWALRPGFADPAHRLRRPTALGGPRGQGAL